MSSAPRGTRDAAAPNKIKKRSSVYDRRRVRLCGSRALNKRRCLDGSTLGAELTPEGIHKLRKHHAAAQPEAAVFMELTKEITLQAHNQP